VVHRGHRGAIGNEMICVGFVREAWKIIVGMPSKWYLGNEWPVMHPIGNFLLCSILVMIPKGFRRITRIVRVSLDRNPL